MSEIRAERLKLRPFKADQFPAPKVKFSALWIAVALRAGQKGSRALVQTWIFAQRAVR
jgi:hypothetical protein